METKNKEVAYATNSNNDELKRVKAELAAIKIARQLSIVPFSLLFI